MIWNTQRKPIAFLISCKVYIPNIIFKNINLSLSKWDHSQDQQLLARVMLHLIDILLRESDKIPVFKTKHNFYKNLFFLSTTVEWNNFTQDLRNSESYTLFRYSIQKFIRPSPNSFCSFYIVFMRAVFETFQFCFPFLQNKSLLLKNLYVLQTMSPKSDLRIAPIWSQI